MEPILVNTNDGNLILAWTKYYLGREVPPAMNAATLATAEGPGPYAKVCYLTSSRHGPMQNVNADLESIRTAVAEDLEIEEDVVTIANRAAKQLKE